MEIIDWLNHHCLHRRISITILIPVSMSLPFRLATSLKATSSKVISISFHRFLLIFQPTQQLLIHSDCCFTPSLNCFAARYSPLDFVARCSTNLIHESLHFSQMIWSTQRLKFEADCSFLAREPPLPEMDKIYFCKRIYGSFPCRE